MACPVIQTSGGTSFIPGLQERTFPYLFSPAANQAVEESDLCVALGTELGEPMHYGRTQHWAANDANRKWVYVEQDPTAIGVNRRFDVALVGDLRGVVPQLVEALRDNPRSPSANLETLVKADAAELTRVAEEAPSGRTPVHPARYVVEATKAFDEFAKDGIMVRDGGATVIFRLDLLADQAARRDLEPELRSSGHGSAVRRRCLGRRGAQAARHAADE